MERNHFISKATPKFFLFDSEINVFISNGNNNGEGSDRNGDTENTRPNGAPFTPYISIFT